MAGINSKDGSDKVRFVNAGENLEIRFGESEAEKIVMSRRALIRYSIGAALIAVPGIIVGPEILQALKVNGLRSDVVKFMEWINEAIANKSEVAADPDGFAHKITMKAYKLDDLMDKLDRLYEDGFRIRLDLAYELDAAIKEGIAFTHNDNLEGAREMIGKKSKGGLWNSSSVFVTEWLLGVNVYNYGSLIEAVDLAREQLMKLRKKVVRFGDIDVYNATINYIVNTFGGIPVESGSREAAMNRKDERIEKLRRLDELDKLNDKLSRGDNGGDVERMQNLLVEFGFLKESGVDGNYGGGTEGALTRYHACVEKGLDFYKVYERTRQVSTVKDPQIKDFQHLLVYMGYLPEGEDDGKYGEKTHVGFKKLADDVDDKL
jgi:hypothetical protein